MLDVGSGTLRDNILPLPYKEPSQVLFTLLNSVVEEGRRFAATADLQVSDMSANSPVGSTLALLERQLKVMTAVQARVHFALKQELQLLAGIIRDYTPDEYTYEPDGEVGPRAKGSDYDNVNILSCERPQRCHTVSACCAVPSGHPVGAVCPADIQLARVAPRYVGRFGY
jgi:hypothetical protein